MLRLRVATVLGGLLVAASFAPSARAEDFFEIEVFHSPIVAPQHLDLELHSNFAARGPSIVPSGDVSTRGVLYEMIEPSFGIAPGWEIAAHIQQALLPGGVSAWGGNKLRVMGVFVDDDLRHHWHLALNVEGGYEPARFDPALWAMEVRPVLEWSGGGVDVDFNPVVAMPFGGQDAGLPELQPAFAFRLPFAGLVQPSIEYYAQLGPISRPPPLASQRHYVFETVDLLRWREWIIHFGVGEGLTSASSRFIVTSLLGRHF